MTLPDGSRCGIHGDNTESGRCATCDLWTSKCRWCYEVVTWHVKKCQAVHATDADIESGAVNPYCIKITPYECMNCGVARNTGPEWIGCEDKLGASCRLATAVWVPDPACYGCGGYGVIPSPIPGAEPVLCVSCVGRCDRHEPDPCACLSEQVADIVRMALVALRAASLARPARMTTIVADDAPEVATEVEAKVDRKAAAAARAEHIMETTKAGICERCDHPVRCVYDSFSHLPSDEFPSVAADLDADHDPFPVCEHHYGYRVRLDESGRCGRCMAEDAALERAGL